MTRLTKAAAVALVVVEGIVSVPFLLISWWLCAVYRSVLLGWVVSGMESAQKRTALLELLGGDKP